MAGALNLIKESEKQIEKRIFPRFPFNSLSFKEEEKKQKKKWWRFLWPFGRRRQKKNQGHAFEVDNISFNGMQLTLKNGKHGHKIDDLLKGTLSWRGDTLKVQGVIKWISKGRLGVSFDSKKKQKKGLARFLSVDKIVAGMRAVHRINMDLDLPTDLKSWLRADGPVEIFVWQHKDGHISHFQFVLTDCFVEWRDGRGIRTGSILELRDKETPLSKEDEFTFKMDGQIEKSKVSTAQKIVERLTAKHLDSDTLDFLKRKLSF